MRYTNYVTVPIYHIIYLINLFFQALCYLSYLPKFIFSEITKEKDNTT